MAEDLTRLKRRVQNVEEALILLTDLAQSHSEMFDDNLRWHTQQDLWQQEHERRQQEHEEHQRTMNAHLQVLGELVVENARGLADLRVGLKELAATVERLAQSRSE